MNDSQGSFIHALYTQTSLGARDRTPCAGRQAAARKNKTLTAFLRLVCIRIKTRRARATLALSYERRRAVNTGCLRPRERIGAAKGAHEYLSPAGICIFERGGAALFISGSAGPRARLRRPRRVRCIRRLGDAASAGCDKVFEVEGRYREMMCDRSDEGVGF